MIKAVNILIHNVRTGPGHQSLVECELPSDLTGYKRLPNLLHSPSGPL